jgi:hypothetical protein
MTHTKLTIKDRAYAEKNKSVYNALELQETKKETVSLANHLNTAFFIYL